ncbi:pirin family protein [Myxococcus sp. AB025B]|uniref:pirin family protein n=1 Tax=Myxococcus sp. AB025B TaxID=2562794 RepID=UPI001E399E9B|nr:pirin family protein [Myxococcus sp. AB025B]
MARHPTFRRSGTGSSDDASQSHVVTLSRRAFVAGSAVALSGCRTEKSTPMPHLEHRPLASLPRTTLSWLSLRDHFVATVGPHAGRGKPLGPLLVLADATFAPKSRFPLHPHEEMEILSIVVEGTLSHHGDQAHGATMGARTAQLISARDGMVHAEGNDTDSPTRMLQLWFRPNTHGGPPVYSSRDFSGGGRQLIAGDEGMSLRADVKVWWLPLAAGRSERLTIGRARRGYLLATTGPVRVEAVGGGSGVDLALGEGAQLGEGEVQLSAATGSAALWIDVA